MKKLFAFAAVVGVMFAAATMDRANAMSLSGPGAAGTAKYASEGFTTEVRGGHHGGGHRGGGRHWGGGHWRGHRHWGYRPRYYAPRYYYAPRRCRVVMTYYGPRRICRPRHYW